MEDRPPPRSAVRFGAFEVDLQAGELRKSGIKLKLHDQPFRILVLLLKRPGETVTREEMQHELWPEHTFVDFENSLNSAVARLREVLGDSAHSPRFIETVHRKGYCFVAPIEDLGTPAEVQSEVHAPTGVRRASSRWFIVGMAAVTMAGAAIWLFTSTPGETEVSFVPIPLTSYPGAERQPTLSPDGNQVAFSWNGEDRENYDIYVKLVGTDTQPLRLTSHPAREHSPAWSPNGKWIAFLREISDGKAEIILRSPHPGPENRRIGEMREPGSNVRAAGPFLAWSSDNSWLVIADRPTVGEPSALFRLSIDGLEKHRLTAPREKGSLGDVGPTISPDGRSLAFTRLSNLYQGELYVLGLNGELIPTGKPKKLTSFERRTHNPTWTPDGREIVFSSGHFLDSSLWRIAATGDSEPRRLAFAGVGGFHPTVSLAGNRLVYERNLTETNIWRVELPDHSGEVAPTGEFIVSSYRDQGPHYSPDGRRIVFGSNRSGSYEIWICDGDGRNPIRLTSLGAQAGSPRWSPEGGQVVFGSRVGPSGDIYVVDVAEKIPRRLTKHPSVDDTPSWSTDGQWIYFGSRRTGTAEIWKIPAAGGEAVQLTRNGGRLPLEAPDGSFVFYVRGRSIWRTPGSGGREEELVESGSGSRYAVEEDGVYFIPRPGPDETTSLEFFDFAQRRTTRIATIGKEPGFGLTVSPDRRWLLYSQHDHRISDLMLVEDFR